MRSWTVVLVLIAHCGCAQIVPLKTSHAHNDYWHTRPLLDALDNGFTSVEVDVHLLKGDLLVNHEAAFTNRRRTLEKLYLQPLFERAKANNFGSVFPNGPKEFILYIDIKQGCPDLLDTLIHQLKRYEPMLTVWEDGKKKIGAVSVIVGACGMEERWLSDPKRWFYFDAHLDALEDPYDSEVIPRVSAPFSSVSKWKGVGAIPSEDLEKIERIVLQAHAQGRELRFWAAGNSVKVWTVLSDAGVDRINVDQLRKFKRFMEKRSQSKD